MAISLMAMFLGAAMVSATLQWPAATLPLLLSAIGTPAALALTFKLIRAKSDNADPVLKPGDLSSFSWLVLCVVAITLLGFQLGGFIFAAAYFRFSGAFRWNYVFMLSIPVPVFAWLAFHMLLGRPGFDGVLLGPLF